MATAEQLKSLIRSHYSGQNERFYTIALQIAAQEAKLGHSVLANELRELLDFERKKIKQQIMLLPQDLQGLLLIEEPQVGLSSLVIPQTLKEHLQQILIEYRQQEKLKAFGLSHRRKILLVGPPGTGKSLTARVIAKELGLSLHTIQTDRLVTKYMGETAAKLRQIFDMMGQVQGVYLFDEFDAIGGERSMDNEVGEMRRVLNTFLQLMDQDHSDSIVIAITNNSKLLDNALFRRFDDVLHYEMPSEDERRSLIANILGQFFEGKATSKSALTESENLSHAEIDLACRDAVKKVILEDGNRVSIQSLQMAFRRKKNVRGTQLR